ncbi:MAG: hypothetical protein J0M04_09510 [Verrucomicrobia bacterium]|nr:hypothetical protein [Verrucomicrobiota bacterium]
MAASARKMPGWSRLMPALDSGRHGYGRSFGTAAVFSPKSEYQGSLDARFTTETQGFTEKTDFLEKNGNAPIDEWEGFPQNQKSLQWNQ